MRSCVVYYNCVYGGTHWTYLYFYERETFNVLYFDREKLGNTHNHKPRVLYTDNKYFFGGRSTIIHVVSLYSFFVFKNMLRNANKKTIYTTFLFYIYIPYQHKHIINKCVSCLKFFHKQINIYSNSVTI